MKDAFVEVPAGIAVFKEGEVGAELYIIESGEVELLPRGGAALATLGPGEFLGEMALLDNQPHAVTALAKAKTRLLRIECALLPEVLRQNGEIGLSLLRQLAQRAVDGEQRLRDLASEIAKSRPPAPVAPPRVEPPTPVVPAQAPPRSEPPTPVANTTVPLPTRVALQVSGAGQVIALDPARSEFLVGRPDPVSGAVPEIDLGAFDSNRTLSRRHAKILREDGQYFVCEDNATTNGTYLNGERLQTGVKMPLKTGDKLRFGSIEVELVSA
jgi:hypothetical protein